MMMNNNLGIISAQSLRNGYSKPPPSLEGSSLVSLMYPSQMQLPPSSSSTELSSQVHSFEDPFDDPNMEPLPLGPASSSEKNDSPFMEPPKVPSLQSQKMLYSTRESFNNTMKTALLPSNVETIKLLSSILSPSLAAGNKRISESPSQQHVEEPLNSQQTKRRKLHHHQCEQASSDEESVARFRPYQENQWRIQFKKLIEFKLRTGHCCVPHSYPEDQVLARWVKRQRYQYKKLTENDPTSTMTTRRIEELEAVGFVWHSHHAAWLEKLDDLKSFKEKTGHCNVPSHHPENVQLSTWVKCQRRQYKMYVQGKSSNMTTQRFEALERLGFVFDIRNKRSNKKAMK